VLSGSLQVNERMTGDLPALSVSLELLEMTVVTDSRPLELSSLLSDVQVKILSKVIC
jgi:hypothetical protein